MTNPTDNGKLWTKEDFNKIFNDHVLRSYHVDISKDESMFGQSECLGKNAFDVSSYFSPVAVKDQIIRVWLILDRAFKNGILGNDKKLLVIGAGPAGMAASIKAALHGAEVVLIEKQDEFGGQVARSPRVICPTQYDWTGENWDDGVMKIPYKSISEDHDNINFTEGEVKILVGEFHHQILLLKGKGPGKIDSRTKTEMLLALKSPENLTDKRIIASFKETKRNEKENPLPLEAFDMVLVCAGFPREIVEVKDLLPGSKDQKFTGPFYWEFKRHDEFLKTEKSILICGGGDGALQDFLMFAVKPWEEFQKTLTEEDQHLEDKTAKFIFKCLKLTEPQRIKLERAISIGERDRQSNEMLNNRDSDDFMNQNCPFHVDLHWNCYKPAVEELLKDEDLRNRLNSLLSDKAKKGDVKLLLQCNHFTSCYPLNHFLVFLISKYLEDYLLKNEPEAKRRIMIYNRYVLAVRAEEGYKCNPQEPHLCYDHSHTVYFQHSTCKVTSKNVQPVPNPDKSEFDIVLIRFGIGKSAAIIAPGPSIPGLQMLPLTFAVSPTP